MKKAGCLLAAALLLAACDRKDMSQDAVELGDRRAKVGAFREAIRSYESALDGTAKTADLHYKIGVIYDDKLKSPLDAVHHYDRYLEFAPNGSRAKDVKIAKADCEKRLQMSMKSGGFMTTAEAARLQNDNELLRKQLNDLRASRPPAPSRTPDPAVPDKLPPGAKKHVVAKGDTLASIAYKYYKNRALSPHIKDANFNQLGGKDIIKPGMTLIIPELPAKKRP